MSQRTIPSVNKYDYTMGLVTHFSVKNTQALIDMRDNDARTVRLWKETLCNNGENRHGLATLNSNNSVVYDQKHKVWVLDFLVRTSGTFWDQNLADLVIFLFSQQNRIVYSNSMQETLLRLSSNGLGNKTVISCLFVVKANFYPSVPWTTTWCTIALGLVQ